MFEFFGLPVHPLAVHATVVLLPLTALALLAIIARETWRERLGVVVMAGLVVSAVAAFVTKASGEELAEHIGIPARHASLGIWVPWAALALLVFGSVWYALARKADRGDAVPGAARGLLAALAALTALGTVVLTGLTGHTGATAVWGGTLANDQAQPATSASPSTPSSSATPTESATSASPSSAEATSEGYTMAQVKEHDSRESCWAVIDGDVYDLTAWINDHPGGEDKILGLCGTDATSAFSNQHAGDGEPQQRLASFKLGPLR